MLLQRFTFKFWNSEAYRGQTITIMGRHRQDSEVGAWAVLADREHDRDVRDSWRVVSMAQAPVALYHVAPPAEGLLFVSAGAA